MQLDIYRVKKEHQIESLEVKQILLEVIAKEINKYCQQFFNKLEIDKRMQSILRGCFDDINQVFLKTKISPDKLILIALKIVELANNEGIWFPPFIEKIFEIFLAIEYLHNIDQSEEDLQRVVKSAEKQARKIILELRNKGYFKIKK